MADVTTSIVINAPVEVVADYSADPDNAPEWYENIQSIEWVTKPPVQHGSRMKFLARFLGRTMRYVYEVVEFEPRQRMVMQTTSGMNMETTYEWRDAGGGTTEMKLRNRGGAGSGVVRMFDPIGARAMRAANKKDLAKLKAILEAR